MTLIAQGPRVMQMLDEYSVPSQLTVVLFGDSITATHDEEQINRGYFNWAETRLGWIFSVANYAGVGGNTTAQMYARLTSDVLDYDADYVVVMGGANDLAGGSATAAEIQTNLENICDDILADGSTGVFLSSVPPSDNYDATALSDWATVNGTIETYANATAGVHFVDAGTAYSDPAAPGTPLAGYTHDGVHPTALGAKVMGDEFYTVINGLGLTVPAHTLTTSYLPIGYRPVVGNPLMLGSGGDLDSGATGTVCNQWQGSQGTFSKVARSDDPGEWQQLELPGASSVARLNWATSVDIDSGFAIGDTVVAEVEFETDDDWSGITQFVLYLQFRDSGGSEISSRHCLANDPNTGSLTSCRLSSGLLRTVPTAVPASTANIRSYLYFAGDAGTVRVGRYEIKITG